MALSLLLPQPPAKVRAAQWSRSDLSVIQTVKTSTFLSEKKTSIK